MRWQQALAGAARRGAARIDNGREIQAGSFEPSVRRRRIDKPSKQPPAAPISVSDAGSGTATENESVWPEKLVSENEFVPQVPLKFASTLLSTTPICG